MIISYHSIRICYGFHTHAKFRYKIHRAKQLFVFIDLQTEIINVTNYIFVLMYSSFQEYLFIKVANFVVVVLLRGGRGEPSSSNK